MSELNQLQVSAQLIESSRTGTETMALWRDGTGQDRVRILGNGTIQIYNISESVWESFGIYEDATNPARQGLGITVDESFRVRVAGTTRFESGFGKTAINNRLTNSGGGSQGACSIQSISTNGRTIELVPTTIGGDIGIIGMSRTWGTAGEKISAHIVMNGAGVGESGRIYLKTRGLETATLDTALYINEYGRVYTYNAVRALGMLRGIRTITSDYTATIDDDTYIKSNTSSNSIVLELPDTSSLNKGYEIKIKTVDVTNTLKVIAFSQTLNNVNSIDDQGGDTFRYTTTGLATGVNTGDYVKFTNNSISANNGTFLVTGTDSLNYVEVTNASGVAQTSTPGYLQKTSLDADYTTLNEVIVLVCDSDNNVYERF